MPDFISFKKINSTRKPHKCLACGGQITTGEIAYAWTAVDDGIFTAYLHELCGLDVENHCFACGKCDDGDGYFPNYMIEAMRNDNECAPCMRLRMARL